MPTTERTAAKARNMRIAARAAEREPSLTTLHKATLETSNFQFEAYGADHDSAWGALVQGLKRHGATHRLRSDWFGEFLSDIQVRAVTLGVCYRDREVI